MEGGLGLLLSIFAVLWGVQIWGSQRQARRFMREVGRIRGAGRAAVGVSDTRRIRPKRYVALSTDGVAHVAHAIELTGTTVFARPRPVPELEGRDLREVARMGDGDRRGRAAAMAAQALLGD